MYIAVACPTIKLAPMQILRIRDGAGLRIVCLSGALWLTQEGDPRDLFLEKAQQFTLDHPGLTLIQTLRNTEIQLERCLEKGAPFGVAAAMQLMLRQ